MKPPFYQANLAELFLTLLDHGVRVRSLKIKTEPRYQDNFTSSPELGMIEQRFEATLEADDPASLNEATNPEGILRGFGFIPSGLDNSLLMDADPTGARARGSERFVCLVSGPVVIPPKKNSTKSSRRG